MALIRVADYLQLQPERAPMMLLRLRRPQSPVSLQAWRTHNAVEHVSWDDPDPQAINVELGFGHAHQTHLQVRGLLDGLQREMDTSSAVIREVYGRHESLLLLRLDRTRIRSNIHEPALLSALPFVPEKTGFEADPNILTQCCPGKVAPTDGKSLPLNVLWPVLPGNDLKSRGRKWPPERSIPTRHNGG